MPGEVDEGYFNDLSRQPRKGSETSLSPPEASIPMANVNQELPKTKRIACVICRKRKLKCDGNRPKCATCARLGHDCKYDEVRKKSGPKRGYVKELEARLAQVEAQVKHKPAQQGKRKAPSRDNSLPEEVEMDDDESPAANMADVNPMADASFPSRSPYSASASNQFPEAMNTSDFAPDMSFGLDDNFSWEMIGLGLEEPMPTQEAIDELTHIFFEKIHPSTPMLHKFRYYSTMSLSPQARPPICLRYAMWANAALVTEKYAAHDDIFYRRARKYLDMDELRGAGEGFVTIAHAQTYVLLSSYEFKLMYFPRAWMSCGKASRLCLMMGLNRLDGTGMDVKQCLPPPKDWIEREERRRTFWMAYCIDRYASIGTGWPMGIDERDVMTCLPASEEAYESGTEQKTSLMGEAMSHQQIANMSTMAGVVYVTHFFGMNLTHLHRPEADDDEPNLQGKFWKRHRKMDNILSNLSLALPSHLRLPAGVRDPNIVFLNFCAHTSTICLHQAAIFKAQQNQLAPSTVENSRSRCLMAAGEVVNIMRLTSHLDISSMNPYLVFCLYVSARVLVQYLKTATGDGEAKASLEFLLTAMAALRKKVPLAESFMIQLQLDIEGNGLDLFLHNPDFSSIVKDKATAHTENCASMAAQREQGINIPEVTHSRDQHDWRVPDTFKTVTSYVPTNHSSPSIRAEEPRQTAYALGNIQLNAREAAANYSYTPSGAIPEASGIQGILPAKTTWGYSSNEGAMHTFEADINAPIGLNPIVNNIIPPINPYDADMSDQSRPSRHDSTGLTPQSSHSAYQSSSNTSYSPPTVTEDDPLTSASAVSGAAGTQTSIEATIDGAGMAGFKVPPGWENAGGTGLTPGFTGMSPGASADWEKMMQGINWDGTTTTGMTPK